MSAQEARIDLRVSNEFKTESEWAAKCERQSLTNFVKEAITSRIRAVREERERTILSERDRNIFLAILDNEEPSEALRNYARKYKDAVESGELHVGDKEVRGRTP